MLLYDVAAYPQTIRGSEISRKNRRILTDGTYIKPQQATQRQAYPPALQGDRHMHCSKSWTTLLVVLFTLAMGVAARPTPIECEPPGGGDNDRRRAVDMNEDSALVPSKFSSSINLCRSLSPILHFQAV